MPDPQTAIRVVLVYSPEPRMTREWTLTLPAGATLSQALMASSLPDDYPDVDVTRVATGVWGRKAALDQVLREGDRVEVYRGLLVDPKVARRERFRKQGARGAGLFAKRRPGAKPGY